MRILITLTYYRPHYSGLTIYTERVARALVERGHQVTILTSRFDKTLKPQENCAGITVIRQNVWFHISKGVIMPSMPFQTWKWLKHIDLVHLHVPQLDAAPISLLSKIQGKPIVLTYHCDLNLPSGFIHSVANWVSNLANHITARTSDVIVTNTLDYAIHSKFLQRYAKKIIPIYPPIEVPSTNQQELVAFRKKYKILPDQRLIGMAARLASEKGVEFLAKALPIIMESYPDARVLFVGPYQDVVGEESYAQRVKQLIQPLGDHWTFLGVLSPSEMAAFFCESEVIALPSINSTESFGMVQIEAMTCGTPVVASDIPGVRVAVQETKTGIIIPPANTIMLADAIIRILDKPAAFKGNPEKIIENSSPQIVAQQYEKIFTDLLDCDQSK